MGRSRPWWHEIEWRPAIVAGILMLVIGYTISFLVAQLITSNAREQAEATASRTLTSRLGGQLTAADFAAPATGERRADFERFAAERLRDAETLRVNLWNTNGVIALSDDPELPGTSADYRDKLAAALQGETSSQLEWTGSTDADSPLQILEVYVPVTLPGSNEIVGALQVYRDYDASAAHLADVQRYVTWGVGGSLLATYLLLMWLVQARSRALLRQNEQLTVQSAALEHADELNRLKSDFVATASHELRTPLTGILGFAALLRSSQQIDDTAREWATTIYEESERLTVIVNDLLNVARIEAGTVEGELGRVQVHPIVSRVVDLARTSDEAATEFETDVADDLFVTANEQGLTEVLHNLVENAVKYSPAGGVTIVGASIQGDRVALSVTDTGLGIPPNSLGEIFDRFRRLELPDRAAIRGTGLGLFIVKELVEGMGGTLEVASRLGEGSTFTVLLPVASRESVDVESLDAA